MEGAEPLGDEREGVEDCCVADVGRGDREAGHKCGKGAWQLGQWRLHGDCNIRGGGASDAGARAGGVARGRDKVPQWRQARRESVARCGGIWGRAGWEGTSNGGYRRRVGVV